ncbi:MAG TPA: Hsp20/alpha crystallin family protein [Verrucomicrobiae bacterium]|jgi:HSP20 family protein|nr:Hsp20/alpha crystallin family protein [Verrucomicrobiae bacterium]
MNTVAQEEVRPQTAPTVETPHEYISPGVNIVETKDGYVLEAEMPGVNKDGLDIQLEENILTLVGRRAPASGGTSLHRESRAADFRRVFELDPSIDAQKINARIDQGILTLNLPKAEKVKPRKITVG